MKKLLVLLLLLIVLLSGCIQEISNVVKCEPNWLLVHDVLLETNEEYCKTMCYNGYKSTTYRFENSSSFSGFYSCYCDANNCSPK